MRSNGLMQLLQASAAANSSDAVLWLGLSGLRAPFRDVDKAELVRSPLLTDQSTPLSPAALQALGALYWC